MSRILELVSATALSPILIGQALWVVSRAQRLPEAQGAREGVIGNGPPLRLLVLGDSSAAGVGVESQDQALAGNLSNTLSQSHRVEWNLLAQSGATTADAVEWVRHREPAPCEVALIALGVNDVKNGVPMRLWLRNICFLIAALKERHGAQLICFSALPPMGHFPLLPNPLRWTLGRRAIRFDAALQKLVDTTPGCRVVRPNFKFEAGLMAADGFHPGPEVYRIWAETAAATIHDEWKRYSPSHVED